MTLEALAERLGLTVDEWHEESESAVKVRPVWERVMADARRGRLGVLLIWALDRIGRSMVDMFLTVAELDGLHVRVVSEREAWLDTASPSRTAPASGVCENRTIPANEAASCERWSLPSVAFRVRRGHGHG